MLNIKTPKTYQWLLKLSINVIKEKQIAEQNKTTPKQTYHVFTIEDDKDAQIVKLLLQQNNIKFDYKNY